MIKTITGTYTTLLIIMLIGFNINIAIAQESTGTISGTVIDNETRQPIISATIRIDGSKLGSITNKKGYFVINKVPVGIHLLKISSVGYQQIALADIVVVANRNKAVNSEMNSISVKSEGVTVSEDYFPKLIDNPASIKTLESQEIRRSPGSAEDIFRVMQSLPGVSTAGGKSAQLIVRGGSPDENLTLLDDIEIYNPIHFARSGESMGVISVINPTLLKKVDFLTGGFPSKYGDKMSSVFDMTLNDGNKEMFNTDVNLNLAGFGITVDGPITENSSVIFSLRRGFFDILTAAMNKPAAPRYYDAVGKVTYNLDDINKISLIGFYYLDQIDKAGFTKENAGISKYEYMTRDDYGAAFGINWQSLFSSKAFSLTTFSYSSNGWNTRLGSAINKNLKGDDIRENEYTLKTEITHITTKWLEFKGGAGVKFVDSKHTIWSPEDTTKSGQLIPASSVSYFPDLSEKYFGFIQSTVHPISNLAFTAGLRYDNSSLTKENNISPRISGSYDLFQNTTLNVAYGIFYQTPAAYQIAIDTANHTLKSSKATHYIVGVEQRISDDTRLTVEAYYKDMNSVLTANDLNNVITNTGIGYCQGFEIYLQKKFTQGFVGSLSYTYSVSKRQDNINIPEYLFEYDRPHIVNLIIGYEIFKSWNLGVKFQYATGNPYTPYIGVVKKQGMNFIVEGDRNSARYPDYHKIDVRLDKTFNLGSWSINAYLDLWNIYNRANVISYTFQANADGTVKTNVREDFGILPVLGVNILF